MGAEASSPATADQLFTPFNAKSTADDVADDHDLSDRVFIVTGSNQGLGKETVRVLASHGATVIMGCRSLERGRRAREEILASLTPGANRKGNVPRVEVLTCDTSSLNSVRAFYQAFLALNLPLHVLICNAGVMSLPERELSVDGFEMQYATNHLGHFLLIQLALDKLKSSAPSRIVVVSSRKHHDGTIAFDDIHSEVTYDPIKAYCQSKLANVLVVRYLAKLLEGTGVSAFSLHPGLIHTGLFKHDTIVNAAVSLSSVFANKTIAQGAATIVFAAIDPSLDGRSGLYLKDCAAAPMSKAADNEDTAVALWELSLEQVGLLNYAPTDDDNNNNNNGRSLDKSGSALLVALSKAKQKGRRSRSGSDSDGGGGSSSSSNLSSENSVETVAYDTRERALVHAERGQRVGKGGSKRSSVASMGGGGGGGGLDGGAGEGRVSYPPTSTTTTTTHTTTSSSGGGGGGDSATFILSMGSSTAVVQPPPSKDGGGGGGGGGPSTTGGGGGGGGGGLKKRPRTDFVITKKSSEVIFREPGFITGQPLSLSNLSECSVFAVDNLAQVTADSVNGSFVFIGPTEGSVMLRECKNSVFVVLCGQFRCRDCESCQFFLAVKTDPVIESSSKLRIGCAHVTYEGLDRQFAAAGLERSLNKCFSVFDFTPCSLGEDPHWTPTTAADAEAVNVRVTHTLSGGDVPVVPVEGLSFAATNSWIPHVAHDAV